MKTPPRVPNWTAWEERYANFSALREVCTAPDVSAIRQRTCVPVGLRLQGQDYVIAIGDDPSPTRRMVPPGYCPGNSRRSSALTAPHLGKEPREIRAQQLLDTAALPASAHQVIRQMPETQRVVVFRHEGENIR
jgi:hypothetical protein